MHILAPRTDRQGEHIDHIPTRAIVALIIGSMWLLNTSFEIAKALPILFVPTFLFYIFWCLFADKRKTHIISISTAFVVSGIAGIIGTLFINSILQSFLNSVIISEEIKNSGASPVLSQGVPENGRMLILLLMTMYIRAGLVEETMKLLSAAIVARKYMSSSTVVYIAFASGLGFSTSENCWTLLRVIMKSSDSFWYTTVARTCMVLPFRVGLARRLVLGQNVYVSRILFLPVFLHGSFDSGIMLLRAYFGHRASVVFAMFVTFVSCAIAWWSVYRLCIRDETKNDFNDPAEQHQVVNIEQVGGHVGVELEPTMNESVTHVTVCV